MNASLFLNCSWILRAKMLLNPHFFALGGYDLVVNSIVFLNFRILLNIYKDVLIIREKS